MRIYAMWKNVPQSIWPSARRITAEQPMETYFQQVLSLQPQTADGWRTILPLPKTMSSQWGVYFLQRGGYDTIGGRGASQ